VSNAIADVATKEPSPALRVGDSSFFPHPSSLILHPSSLAPNRLPRRAGVTLLELLIVMTIMLMVTAAAIPVMMPAMQNRRMREASRLTSSFISGARARAIETGRPAGVMLERFNGLPMAMQLSYVEVPPPYSGDTLSSKVVLNPSGRIVFMGIPPLGGPTDELWRGMIRYGDLVRLDYKGRLYRLASGNAAIDPKAGEVITTPPPTGWYLLDATGAPPTLPRAFTTVGVPFQIIRQPVRSSATPLQLPEGTVVDLISSGSTTTGTNGSFNVNSGLWNASNTPLPPSVPYNPVIMFSPNGSVSSVTSGNAGSPSRPNSAIHLLIGRRELMYDITATSPLTPTLRDLIDKNLSEPPSAPPSGAPPLTASAFWHDLPGTTPPEHFWVSVAHQTGQVSVAEVAANRQDYEQATPPPTDTLPNAVSLALTKARAFAQTPQSAGGR
jgi:prepilin-type N-terminal cleavage/methylation domain-containing protein